MAATVARDEIPQRPRIGFRQAIGQIVTEPLVGMLVFSAIIGLALLIIGPHAGWRESWRGTVSDASLLPDAELVDQYGRPVSLAQFRGTPVVLTFLYTSCPDVCPTTAARLRQLVTEMGADVTGTAIVAITVDPEHDTPAMAKDFSAKFDMTDRWFFLTGKPEQVAPLLEELGALPKDVGSHSDHGGHESAAASSAAIAHAASIYVYDRDGSRRLVYPTDFQPADIVHDLRVLSNGSFAPPVPFGTY